MYVPEHTVAKKFQLKINLDMFKIFALMLLLRWSLHRPRRWPLVYAISLITTCYSVVILPLAWYIEYLF